MLQQAVGCHRRLETLDFEHKFACGHARTDWFHPERRTLACTVTSKFEVSTSDMLGNISFSLAKFQMRFQLHQWEAEVNMKTRQNGTSRLEPVLCLACNEARTFCSCCVRAATD